MTQTAIATQIHQAFDVHLCVAAQVALDHVIRIDMFTKLQNFGIRQVIDPAGLINADSIADCLGGRGSIPVM